MFRFVSVSSLLLLLLLLVLLLTFSTNSAYIDAHRALPLTLRACSNFRLRACNTLSSSGSDSYPTLSNFNVVLVRCFQAVPSERFSDVLLNSI